MGSGFSKMKKQAKLFEKQMQEMQQQAQFLEVKATSGNGLVTVILNGDKELKKLEIKPECIDPKDPDGLVDLIYAAMQDAYAQLKEQEAETKPQGFPGF